MAYDMEYSNWDSAPLNCPSFCIGPTAPLTTYLFNDTRASSEYTAVVAPSKVIMGVPYYGRKECVAGYSPANAPANAVGSTTPVAEGYLDTSTEQGYLQQGCRKTHQRRGHVLQRHGRHRYGYGEGERDRLLASRVLNADGEQLGGDR